jgi:hypothetical protein
MIGIQLLSRCTKLIHLALGGALLLLGATLDKIYERRCRQRVNSLLDDSLDGTFPASDPTATQDFSSPEQRQGAFLLPSPGRLH